MPLLFSHVADLLEQLSRICCKYPPLLPKEVDRKTHEAITTWFQSNRRHLDTENCAEALLSTLLPERRTDRVYGLKEATLERLFGRLLGLSRARLSDLARYKKPDVGDLADCIERVQRQAVRQDYHLNDGYLTDLLQETAPAGRGYEVTLQEVDTALHTIASRNHFSAPTVKTSVPPSSTFDIHHALAVITSRLQSRELKWLTRLILKNFNPVVIPESLVLRLYHAYLPFFFRVQADFGAALLLLKEFRISDSGETDLLRRIRPLLGTKVGRQTFFKGRSIKHCIDMARGRLMAIEKKYDGEYCQIHIDMTKAPDNQLQIFSKSGKDSTLDRAGVHAAVRKALRLDDQDCLIRNRCILEGELLVYDDRIRGIADFHKIRKHVTRSGLYLGTAKDSPAHCHERLMIVYFDVLLHDEQTYVLGMKQRDRRRLLQRLVKPLRGISGIAESRVLDFASSSAPKQFREIFAQCIVANGEGLVLKPADEPYFDFAGPGAGSYRSCCIKVKREYFSTFGDIGDFAVIGASYDAVVAKGFNIPGLRWTHFWLGCLENKEEVLRWDVRPRFISVAVVTPNVAMMKSICCQASPGVVDVDQDAGFDISSERGVTEGRRLQYKFTTPMVFDIKCFSFDKSSNTNFWTPRYPQITKVHLDRTFRDTISFTELQDMGRSSSSTVHAQHSQEDQKWIDKLDISKSKTLTTAASPDSWSLLPSTPEQKLAKLSAMWSATTKSPESQGKRLISSQPSPTTVPRKRLKFTLEMPLLQTALPFLHDQSCANVESETADPTLLSSSFPARSSYVIPDLNPRALSDITVRNNRISNRKRCHVTWSSPKNGGNPAHAFSKVPFVGLGISTTGLATPPTSSAVTAVQQKIATNATHTPIERTSCTERVSGRISHTASPRTGHSSTLSDYTLILSPCVANMPWLIENLIPATGAQTLQGSQAICKDRRLRAANCKTICLIESKRKGPTVAFIQSLQQALRLRKVEEGAAPYDRKVVEIYDWRLLEALYKHQKCQKQDVVSWRRYWIGALEG